MNKRPPGTHILAEKERIQMLEDMITREQSLKYMIETVCISQQTERAKNEYRSIEQELRRL